MNKAYIALAAGLLLLISSNSFAASMTQGNAGDAVTITTTNVTGDPGFTFNPSSNVNMAGATAPNAFLVTSAHNSIMGKDVGRVYVMASDASTMFWRDATDYATWAAVETDIAADTNSGAVSGQTGWNRE